MKTLKQSILTITLTLLFLLIISNTTKASTLAGSGNCGKNGANLKWTLTKEKTSDEYTEDAFAQYFVELTISGKGEMADFSSNQAPWDKLNINVDRIIIQSGVTSIGKYAFSGNCYDNVTENNFYIPNTVTTIKDGALSGLTNITDFVMPGTIKRFEGKGIFPSSTTHVTLQKGTTYLSNEMFEDCDRLENVVFPEGITTIPKEILFDIKVKNVTIPESVTKLEQSCFEGSHITSIKIPQNVVTIEAYALDGIRNIYIYSTNNNLKIDNNAFTFEDDDEEDFYDITVYGHSNVRNILSANKYTGASITFQSLCTINEHRIAIAPAIAPTQTQNGCIAHYRCVECDARFSDAQGKKPLSNYSWVLPPKKSSPKLLTQVITHAKIKTYKASKLKKKATTIKLNAKSNGNGKLTYKVISKKNKKYIKVSKKGVVTLKKGCKKGKYQIRIRAAKTSKYNPTEVVVTITVKK